VCACDIFRVPGDPGSYFVLWKVAEEDVGAGVGSFGPVDDKFICYVHGCSSLLRDEVKVKSEVFEHVVEVGGIALDRGAALVGRVGEAIGHLAGLLEGGIVEVGMEVGLVVAHGSILSLLG